MIFIICFVILIWYKKIKRRGLQMTIENNNNDIRLGYPGTQSVIGYNVYNSRYNNSSQPNTRSAFVVADNSAYNYDINKICKRYFYIFLKTDISLLYCINFIDNQNINEILPPSYDTINV